MKKILAALTEESFSESVFRFITELHQRAPVHVTVVFVADNPVITSWSVTGMPPDPMWFPVLEERDPVVCAETRKQVANRCMANNIPFCIHERADDDDDIGQLKKESRFADLLIADHALFLESPVAGLDWDHFTRIVRELECPAIVLPKDFRFPRQNIIAYDGSPSSVFALKQYYSVLPELATHPTYLVYRKTRKDDHIPDLDYVEELAAPHYPDLTITETTSTLPKTFMEWVTQYPSPILVCGALGRGALSRLFHKSFSYQHLVEQQVPVFIAHR